MAKAVLTFFTAFAGGAFVNAVGGGAGADFFASSSSSSSLSVSLTFAVRWVCKVSLVNGGGAKNPNVAAFAGSALVDGAAVGNENNPAGFVF